jgi:hydroxymethylbilane synthase
VTRSSPPVLRIGARRSPLARAQVEWVAERLAQAGARIEYVGITTTGDTDPRALTQIGGTGVFTGAVREALLTGRIDLAVHSLKDLPTVSHEELTLLAVPEREDTRDVLVGRRLADLGDDCRIGTGAPRRAAQLMDHAEREGRNVQVVPVRGNVDTRLELVRRGEVDAVVLAVAGLKRLGHLTIFAEKATLEETSNLDTVVKGIPATVLSHQVMLPAPGQGALALEVRRDLGPRLADLVAALDDPVTRAETSAEREFLATLEAGCTAPVGARAVVKSVRGTSVDLTMAAVIGRTLLSNLSEPTKDGPPAARGPAFRIAWRGSTEDPRRFGAEAAGQVLDQLRTH